MTVTINSKTELHIIDPCCAPPCNMRKLDNVYLEGVARTYDGQRDRALLSARMPDIHFLIHFEPCDLVLLSDCQKVLIMRNCTPERLFSENITAQSWSEAEVVMMYLEVECELELPNERENDEG